MKQRFFRDLRIVKAKKEHECCACDFPIKKGDRAFVEYGKWKKTGFSSSYFHADKNCYLTWFDAVQPNKTQMYLEKIHDSKFFGQVDFESWKEEI